jgi:hypothetical protein
MLALVARPHALNACEIGAIRRMRQRGATLQSIAVVVDRSVFAVYSHTKDIVNFRRWNRHAVVNTATGKVMGFTKRQKSLPKLRESDLRDTTLVGSPSRRRSLVA